MKLTAALLGVGLLASVSAFAVDKHGGHEVEAGKYHVELLVKDRDITVYVRDQGDKPIDGKTIKASANVLSGKDKATVELQPSGEGLKAQVPFDVAKNAKVVVTFAVGDGKREQARFSLGAKQDHKSHKH